MCPCSQATVENIGDDKDVSLSLTRAEISESCAETMEQLKQMLTRVLAAVAGEWPGIEYSTVETLGGGSRMPALQEVALVIFVDRWSSAEIACMTACHHCF